MMCCTSFQSKERISHSELLVVAVKRTSMTCTAGSTHQRLANYSRNNDWRSSKTSKNELGFGDLGIRIWDWRFYTVLLSATCSKPILTAELLSLDCSSTRRCLPS